MIQAVIFNPNAPSFPSKASKDTIDQTRTT